ncbi:restriction endonuclease subunit S [Roseibium sp.]|uniref:restriction endonuclease subunit S n=1 Tax=Roseibium sp. TaxID=1936156 RepID=UPI00329A56B5
MVQSSNHKQIEPGQSYKQITVRLWGKGLILRGVCDGAEISATRQIAAQTGDFVISKIDARHGAFGLVPAELNDALVSNDFPCFKIDEEALAPSYLKWYTKTEAFVALCKQSSAGSTNRVRLKEGRFLELEIPLPPLDEQRVIAQRLNDVEAQLQERAKELEAIECDIEAMLQNAFRKIVEGADYRPLGEVAPLVRRPVEIELDGEYPELGARSFGRGLFHKPVLFGSEITWQKLFWVHAGDLVFSNIKAWEGAFGVATAKDHLRVGSHRYLTCVPHRDAATANFLWFYLQSRIGLRKINQASPGSADRNRTLGQKPLMAITVPVPSLDAQLGFDKLCELAAEIRSIRTETAKEADALLPAMLHQIFEKQSSASAAPVQQTDNVVSLQARSSSSAVDTPFKEAVLVAAIIKALHEEGGQPLGNFRLQKAVYFARRFLGETALEGEYLRKAAGPYNPTMRYSGGMKVALDKNWITPASGKYGPGHSPGAAIGEAQSWIDKYDLAQAAAWVCDKFKFKQNDIWELLATIDYAMLALSHQGTNPTSQAVLSYIDQDPEWHPKIAKLGLTEPAIQNAMVEMESLFPAAKGAR